MNSKNLRNFSRLIVAGACALVTISASADNDSRNDSRQFSERDIRGNWGFSADGNLVAPMPGRCPGLGANAASPPCSFVGVGIFSFRRDGECSIKVRMGVDGLTLPPHGQGPASTDAPGGACVYEVNEDGTGVIHENLPNEGPVTLDFVITDREKEIRFIRRDILMVHGSMKRQ